MLTRAAAFAGAAGIACAVALVPAGPAARAAAARPARPTATGSPAGAGPGRAAATRVLADLRGAWQISNGEGVTIAVVNTRVDPSVAGLAGRVTSGRSFGNTAGHSDAGGTVFAEAVAGQGPSGSNPFGTIGLAPGAHILSVPVPDYAPYPAWELDDARAIRFAADHGARVIFIGIIGYDDPVPALDRAVRHAVSRGAVLIADENHWGTRANADAIPNSLPGVLGAASVVLPGLPPPWHRFATPVNDSVLVSAPGNSLTVTGPAGPGYRIDTDFAAAAWLTATAAMIKSVFPHLPPGLVARAIAASARDHPRGGYNTRIGFGLIDPAGALHAAARLAKLRLAARPGTPGTARPADHFGAGPGPGPISAVHHSAARLAGYGGTAAAGLALIVLAAALARRWRRAI